MTCTPPGQRRISTGGSKLRNARIQYAGRDYSGYTGIWLNTAANVTIPIDRVTVSDATTFDIFSITGNLLTNLITGSNELAVEVHQNALTSSDLAMNLQVTGTALVSTNTMLSVAAETHSLVLAWPADAVIGR